MNRNRLPRFVNSLIDRIADAPMSPIGRLAARRLGTPEPVGTVAVTNFDEQATRVLITPVNYSGQATEWARALEASDESISARSAAVDVPGGFSFEADLVVPVATYHNDADWQRRQLAAASHATHVLIEAEEPPFGRLLGRSVEKQAKALKDAGVSVAYLAHGTDVRLPSRHRKQNPWSHYADPEIYAPRAETLAARNIELLGRSGGPVFVSTPDLLLDLPEATWCPVVVDPTRWQAPRAGREPGHPLRVAHAPSVGAVKGTELILPMLERLAAEGIIELDLVRGIPSAEMPAVFARADVVIDQVRIGSYGVAACEAMASGAMVVGHVSDVVRGLVRSLTGLSLPLIEATPESLEQVLRELAAEQDESRSAQRRQEAKQFIETIHDGRFSANALRAAWITQMQPGETELQAQTPTSAPDHTEM